jgi:mono/diheme cytochrome c family protein
MKFSSSSGAFITAAGRARSDSAGEQPNQAGNGAVFPWRVRAGRLIHLGTSGAALHRAIAGIVLRGADGSWVGHVPEADRNMRNPFAGQADAAAGGAKLFSDHCASCHGKDGLGHGKKPSLRSERVQQASDGEVFWLLKNGNLARGMPSWSKLPGESRWQLIAYVKSLGAKSAPATPAEAATRALTGE